MKDMPITMEPDGWLGQTGGYAKDMTLRQYIAIQAMQGLLAHPDCQAIGRGHEKTMLNVADESSRMADVMLQHMND